MSNVSSNALDASTKSSEDLASLLRPFSPIEWLLSYLHTVGVVFEIEVRKLWHDPFELFTRAVQPALWLVVFGSAFTRVRAIPTNGVNYLTFLTPGVLAQSLMFVSIFHGITIIWERDAGILQKFLVMPVPRASFITGKGLGAAVRSLCQVLVIFILAFLMHVQLQWSLTSIIGTLLTVIIGSSFFATLSLLLATLMRTRERFMGIGQVITMPLFFASNAIYPIAIMPDWLRVIAQINPLTYVVDLLRGYLVNGTVPNAALDWSVLIIAVLIVQTIASLTYQTIVL